MSNWSRCWWSGVRLGGVHALAGLADDAPTQDLRQTCIDVLCAYLRLPFSPDPGELPDDISPTQDQREAHQDQKNRYRALRETRHTILRLIGEHYRRPLGTHRSWEGCDLDFTGITIDCDVSFQGATFSGGLVNFAQVVFSGSSAMFSEGTVSFSGAVFSGSQVWFGDATFSEGTVSFSGATFSDGLVYFARTRFSGGVVSFDRTTFSGVEVSFDGATFSDGMVSFDEAVFSGSEVPFDHVTGSVPSGLLAAVSTSGLATVTLPTAWLPSVP